MRNDWLRFSRNGYMSQHVCVCVEHMTRLETLFCILRWLSSQDVRWHFNTSLRLGTQKNAPIQIWIDTQKLHPKTTRPQDVPQRLKIACHPSRRFVCGTQCTPLSCEYRERKFLSVIVIMWGSKACYSHTAHANLSLAFSEVSAATSAAVQSA